MPEPTGQPEGEDLLAELQSFAASDGDILAGIEALLSELQAAAAALPQPDIDTDAIWARVEARAWGPK